MDQEPIFRKATLEDIKPIGKLSDRNDNAVGPVFDVQLKDSLNRDSLVVVECEGKIVGYVNYYHRKRDTQTTLYEICVDKSCRGKGYGRKLVDLLVEESRQLKRKFIYLRCPENLPSNNFYEKYGFKKTGQVKGRSRMLNTWVFTL